MKSNNRCKANHSYYTLEIPIAIKAVGIFLWESYWSYMTYRSYKSYKKKKKKEEGNKVVSLLLYYNSC